MNPPDLSVASTESSTSRCNSFRFDHNAASGPYGSDFSFALRAVRGARMFDKTNVNFVSCFGIQIFRIDPGKREKISFFFLFFSQSVKKFSRGRKKLSELVP